MDIVTLLGSAAALLSTVSFTPQAWKIIRTGETKDISAPTYALTVAAFACWIGYGILRIDWPIIATNTICFLLSGFILAMTIGPENWRQRAKHAVE